MQCKGDIVVASGGDLDADSMAVGEAGIGSDFKNIDH